MKLLKSAVCVILAMLLLAGCTQTPPFTEPSADATVTTTTVVVATTTSRSVKETTATTGSAVPTTTGTQPPVKTTAGSTTEAPPAPIYDIHALDPAKEYVAVGGSIFDFKSADPAHYVVQGGYFDGEYFYIAHISKPADGYEKARILVLDYWGNTVRESEPLALDHANCVTYNDKLDRLVVAHCQSPDGHYNRYSYVDPETLQITDTFDAPQPFFAIGYSAEKQRYASARWGGETLDFWDADMNHLFAVDVERPGSLSQGVFCDGTGVYFVRSSQNGYSSEIRAYDWEGRLVRTIPVELSGNIEPESINFDAGTTYILGNNWVKGCGTAYVVEYKPVD